jgi:two-component sensor histidine kinase
VRLQYLLDGCRIEAHVLQTTKSNSGAFVSKLQPPAALSQPQHFLRVAATEVGSAPLGLDGISAGELSAQLWLERARELEIENARLRRLLEDAGEHAERAFVIQAELEIQHRREIEVAQTETASARSLLRQAYQDTSEHKRLVVGELHHRAKNMLTMVQAIAAQTLRNAGSLEEARSALLNRIAALSQANDVLVGRGRSANIRTIVADALNLLSDGPRSRFRVAGPELQVSSRAALALAMALHELGTNAVKYGALSTDAGAVQIEWEQHEEQAGGAFKLRWTESGGPEVRRPKRRGFGTQLLDRLGTELHGRVDTVFPASGLICRVSSSPPELT